MSTNQILDIALGFAPMRNGWRMFREANTVHARTLTREQNHELQEHAMSGLVGIFIGLAMLAFWVWVSYEVLFFVFGNLYTQILAP